MDRMVAMAGDPWQDVKIVVGGVGWNPEGNGW